MSTSAAKIAANQQNGNKGTGPRDTSRTRYNATKHALLSDGITELDRLEGYQDILADLERQYSPQGCYQVFLVRSAALEMIRCHRARRLEAEQITAALHPPQYENDPIEEILASTRGKLADPGLPATLPVGSVEHIATVYSRYETSALNRLFRIMRELERHQRMRMSSEFETSRSSDPDGNQASQGLNGDPSVSPVADVLSKPLQDSPATATEDILSSNVECIKSDPHQSKLPHSAGTRKTAASDGKEDYADVNTGINTLPKKDWFPSYEQEPFWRK